MHILFGVLGGQPQADAQYRELLTATKRSNPRIALVQESGLDARLGVASRSFAAWHDMGADRSFYLDGEIRSVDGADTLNRGMGEPDKASISGLYEVHGADLWERLDGSFFLAIRDGATWHLGVDTAGARAVYWWFERDILAFHSQLVDLAATYPGTLAEDLGAIGNYLACGLYLPGRTAFRGIRHLGAGQCVTVSPGEVNARDHFQMASRERSTARPEILVDELIERLEAVIARSWRAAVCPVVPLSGGVDSRYMVAELVRQAGPGAVRTITWGEEPARPDSDAVVAAQVAAALGVENVWHEKLQCHTPESFERAIYLSSGEADRAIHYPVDHLLHARLADNVGFASLFRGDEMFLVTTSVVTDRAVLASSSVRRLSRDQGYAGLLDGSLLQRMAAEQDEVLDETVRRFGSSTPSSRSHEALYAFEYRRELAPSNVVKLADLEPYTPFMDREVLEFVKRLPDHMCTGKSLFRSASRRRFPDLARIPYASRSNLPQWGMVTRRDPHLALFLSDWCAAPGWLDSVGARPAVLAQLEAMATDVTPGPVAYPTARRWRQLAKRTPPGRLLRELTLERRAVVDNQPPYLRVARLAVLHWLLAEIARRQSRSQSASG